MKPVIILVTGLSGTGKTTVSKSIKSHHTHLIHGDQMIYTLPKWCRHRICLQLYHQYLRYCGQSDPKNHLNRLAQYLETDAPSELVAEIVRSDYLKTKKKTVIMEGYLFGLPRIQKELMRQLGPTYFIWEMTREIN